MDYTQTQIPHHLDLPTGNGAYVEFKDIDDLTGDDIAAVRSAYRQEHSAGEAATLMYREAMRVAVKTWEVPYLADPRTPEANPAAWKKLKARDLCAVEDALDPLLRLVRGLKPAEGTGPGSPPRPASE